MSDILDEGIAALDRELGIDEPGTDDTATEAAETTDGVATEAAEETAADERPRNADGTFAKAEETPEEAAEEVKQDLILGRFKTDEEVRKAYEELDRAFGQRSQEWGELKKELEQIREQTAPREQPPQAYDPDTLADHFAEHPTSILPTIQQAYEAQDMNLVYLGIAALEDVDRPLAEGLRIEIAKRAAIAELTPHIARSEQAGLKTTLDDAVTSIAGDFPDFAQYGEQVMKAVVDDPELARGLVEGTPDEAKRVLTNLYKIAAYDASRQDTSTLAQAKAAADAEQQQETEAAKREGFVATTGQRVDTEQISEGEKWLADLDIDKHLARYSSTD